MCLRDMCRLLVGDCLYYVYISFLWSILITALIVCSFCTTSTTSFSFFRKVTAPTQSYILLSFKSHYFCGLPNYFPTMDLFGENESLNLDGLICQYQVLSLFICRKLTTCHLPLPNAYLLQASQLTLLIQVQFKQNIF